MNIKILDSWLREYIQTSATPERIAKELSLTSVSIERLEKYKDDLTYDIEVTTNRPDLASVVGLAREAAAVLPQQGVQATFKPLQLTNPHPTPLLKGEGTLSSPLRGEDQGEGDMLLNIDNDPRLVNRICAVIMNVIVKESPQHIKDRLESSKIRSLNNIIDITNYVMRVTGQPTHVFDYDRLGKHIKIREAKKGEQITTLDGKTYTLSGGDIVATNEQEQIVDLLGIMGLENSVVTKDTQRIVFFINNVDANKVRKTSMQQGIRTEAVQLNEKHLDPQLCMTALQYGIQLYQELADGEVIGDVIDIYSNKPLPVEVSVSEEKINQVIGVTIPLKQSAEILKKLGFTVVTKGHELQTVVPSWRQYDVSLPEDLIEEIARVYGYHNLPNELPELVPMPTQIASNNPLYWEHRAKHALKYWGFTETYTYSMVSENMYEGPLESAVTIANPLNEEFVYMRKTLVPSLLQVVSEYKQREEIKIFEIANVYHKKDRDLPDEIQHLAGIVKSTTISFFKVKGIIEQLAHDLGIHSLEWRSVGQGENEIEIYLNNQLIGEVELLDEQVIDFELNFSELIAHATNKKVYTLPNKFPPVLEDISLLVSQDVVTEDIRREIKKQSNLIQDASLIDRYENSRTFHIIYQATNKNLTTDEVKTIHDKIITALKKKWGAKEK